MTRTPGSRFAELSEILDLDKSTLSRTVDSLVKEGYVVREIPPDNRRTVKLSLTKKGKMAVDEINVNCDGYYQKLLQDIKPAERAAVMKSLAAVAHAMTHIRKNTGCLCCGITHPKKEK